MEHVVYTRTKIRHNALIAHSRSNTPRQFHRGIYLQGRRIVRKLIHYVNAIRLESIGASLRLVHTVVPLQEMILLHINAARQREEVGIPGPTVGFVLQPIRLASADVIRIEVAGIGTKTCRRTGLSVAQINDTTRFDGVRTPFNAHPRTSDELNIDQFGIMPGSEIVPQRSHPMIQTDFNPNLDSINLDVVVGNDGNVALGEGFA
mmetsp:Transcript_25643/g.56140  ORF Transcript_25643/g.56140 Transcript_25643/m.56140 type:complete len:205 (+) Transcript_25643:383-997(+)